MIALLLLLTSTARGGVLEFSGRNDNFEIEAVLRDEKPRGHFLARYLRVERFAFKFTPRALPRSRLDFLYGERFGPGPVTLTQQDLEPRLSAAGLSHPDPQRSGYHLLLELNARGREKVRGFKQIGLRFGAIGAPSAPHHVLLLNADGSEGETVTDVQPSVWQRRGSEDRFFREPVLECELRLGGGAFAP